VTKLTENNTEIKSAIKLWVDNVVLGLNLCPFAHDIWKEGRWEIAVSNAPDNGQRFKDALVAIEAFVKNKEERGTMLYVFPEAKENFIRFYNFSAMVEEEIRQMGLQDQVQIVTFHPEFRFEGEKKESRGNYVNRSPYPLLHFLWTEEVTRVIEKNGEKIGEKVAHDNNKKLLSLSDSEFEDMVLKYTRSSWQVESND
jgi:hypothetical protein